jgi:OOP family OmpA-OmpF porin
VPRPTLDAILKQLADRVQFKWNSAVLDADSEAVVGQVATLMLQVPEIEELSIEGHSSKDGAPKYNEQLSADRAQAVADGLARAGVPAARLKVSHFGTKKPVVDNKTEEQRKANRRVELKITKFNTAAPPPPPAPKPSSILP